MSLKDDVNFFKSPACAIFGIVEAASPNLAAIRSKRARSLSIFGLASLGKEYVPAGNCSGINLLSSTIFSLIFDEAAIGILPLLT